MCVPMETRLIYMDYMNTCIRAQRKYFSFYDSKNIKKINFINLKNLKFVENNGIKTGSKYTIHIDCN